MADLIPNLAERWPAAPDWPAATLEGAGVTVRSVAGLYQMLISGDLDAWNRASGLDDPGLGVLAQAKGKAKAWQVRVARDRLLAVSEKPFSIEPGWHGEGFAVTRMDAALHVFEVEGEGLAGVIARATTVDPTGKSSSAALLFAGINAIAYRYATASRLRVHVDRSLAAYLWEWLETAVGVTPTRS